jgi:UDP-glucuronate decarboxylase
VAETLMSDFHREDNVDIRIARIFNTYGPRMAENDGRVVSNFIVQALRGEELTLYGDGEQTRSFCYVDDLVDGLVRLMNSTGEDRYLPVNRGNPVEFTIKELAEEVVKVVGGTTRVTYRPLPQDDPTQRQPDITRARQWLGWEPHIQLADGLVRTVDYFRQRLARRNRAALSRIDQGGGPPLLD